MYMVREIYCYNRTKEQNFQLQVMLCAQCYELDYPFFTLFDKIFPFCLLFPDTEQARCILCTVVAFC